MNHCTKDGYTNEMYWYCTDKGRYYSRSTGWRCEKHAIQDRTHLTTRVISLWSYHLHNKTFRWNNVIKLLWGAIQTWQKEKLLRKAR